MTGSNEWNTTTPEPMNKIPQAEIKDQKNLSIPYPYPRALSAGFLDRLIPISSNDWLSVSAKLCTASANILVEPVTKNTRVLIIVTKKFPKSAAVTDFLPSM